MRRVTKYKNYKKNTLFFRNFPKVRILKFKKSKWLKLQTLFKRRRRRRFLNTNLLRVRFRSWRRVRNSFREGLKLKVALSTLFDTQFSTRFYKKNLTLLKENGTNFRLITLPFFRIDILLWKCGLFRSSFEAIQKIEQGVVNINFKTIRNVNFLKKGDIITFSDSSFIKYSKFESKIPFLYSLLEIDYYSNTLVILKGNEELVQEDVFTLLNTSLSINLFKNYLIRRS